MHKFIIPSLITFLLGSFSLSTQAQDCDCFGAGNCPAAIGSNSSGQICYEVTDAFNNDLSDPAQGICGVAITFTHTHLWDFELSLTSPGGQVIDLIGPNTNTFGTTTSVVWDVTFVPCASPAVPDTINGNPLDEVWDNDQNWPFGAVLNGTYYPVAGNCLESFNAGPVNGTWCLDYTNQPSTFSGQLLNFEIILCDNSGILCCDADAGDLSDYPDLTACINDPQLALNLPPDYPLFEPDTTEYAYTYIISGQDGVILEYDTLPDLTDLPAGVYQVCGLSYKLDEAGSIPAPDGVLTLDALIANLNGANPLFCGDISEDCIEVQLFAPPAPVDLSLIICEGDSVMVGDSIFNQSGTFSVPLVSDTGCDSLVQLDLTVLQADTTLLPQTICNGASVTLEGMTYDTSGTYFIPYTNQDGCDSTLVLELTVLDSIQTDVFDTICQGQIIQIGGISFNATGDYTIVLDSELNCDSFVYLHLTVIDLELDLGPAPVLSCNNPQVTLTSSVMGNSPALSYEWSTQNGNIVGATDLDTAVVDSPGTYVLTIEEAGCQAMDQVQVNGNISLPMVEAGVPDTLTCLMDSLQLDGTGTALIPNQLYQWTTTDGNILADANTLTPWINAAGTYVLSVTNTLNGCSATDSVVIASDQLPPFVEAGSMGLLDCVQPLDTLDGSASLQGVDFQYEWFDANGISLPFLDSLRLEVNQGGWYFLQITNPINGCVAVDSALVVDEQAIPFVDAGITDTLNCLQSSVLLDGSNSSSGPDLLPLWTTELGQIIGSENTLVSTANQPGWYVLTLTDTSNSCVASDSVFIELDTLVPVVEAGPGVELNCDLTSFTIGIPAGTSQGPLFAYVWTNAVGDTLANTLTYTSSTVGTFTLTVTNVQNGCSAMDQVTLDGDQEVPQAITGPGGTLTCDDPSLILNGGDSFSNPFIEFSWLDEAGQLVGEDSLLLVSQPGTFCLVVLDGENLCADTACVEVFSSAQFPGVDAGPDQVLDCTQEQIELIGTTSGAGVPFVYEWTTPDGQITTDETQLSIFVNEPGTYQLTVTDTLNDCSAFDQVQVLLDTAACTPLVNAGANGLVNCYTFPYDTLNASAGTSTGVFYTYQWTAIQGGIIQGATTLTPVVDTGLYVLAVTNTLSGITATDTVAVVADLQPPIANAGANVTLDCNSLNNVFLLDGTGSSAGPFIAYEWSTVGGTIESGGDTATPGISAAGIYDLLVLNTQNGCIAQDATLVTLDGVLPDPCLDPVVQLECGVFDATIGDTCPNADFVYGWTAVQGVINGPTNSPLLDISLIDSIAVFAYTILDTTNNCLVSDTVEVLEATSCFPTCDIAPPDVLTCALDTITLDASASSMGNNFVYEWVALSGNICGGENTLFPCVDAPGTYQLTLTDTAINFSCMLMTNVQQDITPPVVDAGANSLLNCTGNNALLTGNSIPGAMEVSYSWEGPAGSCIDGDPGQQAIAVSCGGTYYFTATRLDNGCSALDSAIVSLDTVAPAANIPMPMPITCASGSTLLQNTGSTTGAAIEYSWLFNNAVVLSGPAATTYLASEAGTYCLEVLDSDNGCIASTCTEVQQDTTLPVADAGPGLSLDCQTDLVTMEGMASTGSNYSYLWSTSDGCLLSDPTNLIVEADCPGTYLLTVTDSVTGCQSTSSMMVSDSTQVPFVDAGADQEIGCGSLQISLDGTNSSQGSHLTYGWTANPGTILSGASTLTPIVSEAGTYFLTITNNNTGCLGIDSVVIAPDTEIPTVNAGADTVLTCSIQALSLSGSSDPTDQVQYQWQASAGGQILSGDTTLTPLINASGTYTLTVTDLASGCANSDVVLVGLDTISPSAVIVPVSTLELTCATPQLVLDGAGSSGQGDLLYTWTTNNGQIIGASNFDTVLLNEMGTYQLIVTDQGNGCTDQTSISVSSDFVFPIIQLFSPDKLTCKDTAVILDGSESFFNGPILVEWSAPPGIPDPIPLSDSLQATVFEPSAYYLTLTYVENGCSITDTVVVTADLEDPVAVANASGLFDCQENTIGLSGEGSSFGPGITYQWWAVDGGNLAYSTSLYPEVDAPGTYALEVIDLLNGCRDTAFTEVFALAPNIEGVLLDLSPPDCFADSSARIVIDSVLGGTPPYVYGLNESAQNTYIWYDYLPAGGYTVYIEDSNGCLYDTTFVLDNPEEVLVDLGPDQTIALGSSTAIEALVNLPLNVIDTILWEPVLDPLCWECLVHEVAPVFPTQYEVTVVDQNGCTATDEVRITPTAEVPVFLGNAFSPNADGNNDVFFVRAPEGVVEVRQFLIFDRWGNLVYEAYNFLPNNPTFGWNGTFEGRLMDPAVFVWWVDVLLENGKEQRLKGDVLLLR